MQKERLFGLRGLDMSQDVLDEIVREEVASAVKYTISTMPIQLIIENSLVEYADKTVDDNYYLLSNRAADALLSAKLDLDEAIERAIMKALKGGMRDEICRYWFGSYTE